MQRVKKMLVTFRDGMVREIKGVFKEESRVVYEVDGSGKTVAVYNFDEVKEIRFFETDQAIMVI